MSTRKK